METTLLHFVHFFTVFHNEFQPLLVLYICYMLAHLHTVPPILVHRTESKWHQRPHYTPYLAPSYKLVQNTKTLSV